MKPTFALDLRNDTITLLHRAGAAWHVVGATAFGQADMDDALARMRASALDLSPDGFVTKLIIPNDQILFTAITAPGPGRAARRNQIREALTGRTPYAVNDLAFDWAGDGDDVIVAAVARETLEQAEGFVASYGLNPVGFTAVPDDPAFVSEPWFGPSSIAATLLPAGAKPEPDQHLVRIEAVPAVAEPAQETVDVVVDDPIVEPAATLAEAVAADLPAPVAEPEIPPDTHILDHPSAFADEPPFPASEALARMQAEDATPVTLPADPAPEPVAPPTIPRWATDDAAVLPAAAPNTLAAQAKPLTDGAGKFVAPSRSSGVTPSRRWFDDPEEAPMAVDVDGGETDEEPAPAPVVSALAPAPASGIALSGVTLAGIEIEDDLPPAPAAPIQEAFASRRVATDDTRPETKPPRPLSGATRPLTTQPSAPAASPRAAAPTARSGTPSKAAKGLKSLVTAPGIAGFRKSRAPDPKRMVQIKTDGPAAMARPAKPSETPFVAGRIGQRERGRPAYMLLILTVALLVAMALVAAWSSYMALRDDPDQTTAVASVTPAPTKVTPPAPVQTAPEPAEVAPEVAADPAPATTAELSTATLPATVGVGQDEILLASQDPPPALPEPVAPPTVTNIATDPPPAADSPPPFGTVLEFDQAGLIKPTPEGIETPEGVFLRSGRPPIVPPPRSAIAEAAALAAEPAAEPAAAATAQTVADPTLAGARPKARPAGLVVPSPDDAALETAPLAEGQNPTGVTVLRPQPRPASVLAAGDAARTAAAPSAADASLAAGSIASGTLASTASSVQINPQTVTISRVPSPRPRDLERSVEAAVAAALQPNPEPAPAPEPAAEPTPEPAPEPRSKPETKTASKALVGRPEEALEGDNEPEVASVAPSGSAKGPVAKNATFRNAIDLGETNLIGVYGTDSRRYAMVRTSAGGYKKVKVGDRVDGGKVAAITTKELRLQKGGSMVVLKIPGG